MTTATDTPVGDRAISAARRRSACLGWSAIAACVLGRIPCAAAQALEIQFNAAVPAAPAHIQIYRLVPAGPPLEFLNEKLAVLRLPPLRLEKNIYIARGAIGDNDLDRVRVFTNPVSGDTHFIPNFAELVRRPAPGATLSRQRAWTLAHSALTDARFIPKDATGLRVGEPVRILGGAATRASPNAPYATAQIRTAPSVVLTVVPAVRYASGFPVYGLGSRAVVSVANDGLVVGALRRWRTASVAGKVRADITGEQVRADIERQLRPHTVAEGTRATVDKIDIAYYDGNARYLQPVYHFEATLHPAGRNASGIRLVGYVPIGKVMEPIPDLAAAPVGPAPTSPRWESQSLAHTPTLARPKGERASTGDVTLGEYANQDWSNTGAWMGMADQFLSGLSFLNSLIPGATPSVVRTQWYIAYPWEVVGPRSKKYLNAVNVAYTEPYGTCRYNANVSTYGDPWQAIGTDGNPGFGAAAGGVLSTWIIPSCEVVPSMYDRQKEASGGNPYTAFDVWWPVFQGLHNVIGFRTKSRYPDHSLQFAFGYDISLGGDVNGAWFQEVAADDPNDDPYHDDHLVGKPLVHYDRASTMVDARNLGQSIYNVGAQSAATTLWNFWMGD